MSAPELTVHLELQNPTSETQKIVFEEGRCFEVASPFTGLQNAVLARSTTVIIPPFESISIELAAYCLNQYRDMSSRHHTAFATPFLFNEEFENQKEIWNIMSRPAA